MMSITSMISELEVGESVAVSDLGSCTRHGENNYSVDDNGESVINLDFAGAVRIATENAEADA